MLKNVDPNVDSGEKSQYNENKPLYGENNKAIQKSRGATNIIQARNTKGK